ncbi:hypothetical protein [Winogradskyella pulchriflava]|uniref:Uncharacterized protein n=1 Tax=Winogradskyella pulchriflava TaxID=1110688 RepID=A0ABV6Q7R5_9FLAO
MKSKEKIEKLKKEIKGYENTIWAYKFEFYDLEDSQRKEVIEAFEKKIELVDAKIKAIELSDVFEEE